MPAPAINACHVFKKFRRGEQFDSLRDLVAGCLRPGRRRRTGTSAEFWAIDDLSFDVQPGESLGIIGPNGAGKSTMLKILAGIMRPNRGHVDIRGRVSALIELGAGFHGDLTGRENIYLNASILGMSRAETERRFEEIVEFAGIGDFLDTPIKRYSSGMHARLGFAIAIHVQPKVLLVDEVLSVGDRVFRAKCLERMRAFLNEGVAVVFVSHDLTSVCQFCDRAIVLDRGKSVFGGTGSAAVGRYFDACTESLLEKSAEQEPLVRITQVRVADEVDREVSSVSPGERVSFEYRVEFDVGVAHPSYGLSIVRSEDQLTLFETSSTRLGRESPPARRGDTQVVRYDFEMNVPPGDYAVGLHVRDRDSLRYLLQSPHAARLLVEGPKQSGGLVHLNSQFAVSPAFALIPESANST